LPSDERIIEICNRQSEVGDSGYLTRYGIYPSPEAPTCIYQVRGMRVIGCSSHRWVRAGHMAGLSVCLCLLGQTYCGETLQGRLVTDRTAWNVSSKASFTTISKQYLNCYITSFFVQSMCCDHEFRDCSWLYLRHFLSCGCFSTSRR
jgi:hypothetical protein